MNLTKSMLNKFHPTFKTVGSNTQRTNKLLIERFLHEISNPWFHPSLRDFTVNTNVWLIISWTIALDLGVKAMV